MLKRVFKLTISAFRAKIIKIHPIVVGTAKRTTVSLVPTLFRRMPAEAVAKVAPSAIIDTIHENWFFETEKLLLSEKRRGAAGLDHPSEIPKMNAPP